MTEIPVTFWSQFTLTAAVIFGSLLARNSELSKQHVETFLPEMIVVRQNVAQSLIPADEHRNAIGEAITFIFPCFIERETGEKAVVSLRDNFDVSVA